MYLPGMVRVSWDLGILWQGDALCMCPFMCCPGMVRGSGDTLTGECSVLVPIHVLSRDGQSILGSWDTLTRMVGVIFSNKRCHENCLHNVHLKNGTASLDMCVWIICPLNLLHLFIGVCCMLLRLKDPKLTKLQKALTLPVTTAQPATAVYLPFFISNPWGHMATGDPSIKTNRKLRHLIRRSSYFREQNTWREFITADKIGFVVFNKVFIGLTYSSSVCGSTPSLAPGDKASNNIILVKLIHWGD